MRFFLTLVSVSALLSACGGGGGGGGGSAAGGSTTPLAAPVALTQANYLTAAQETLSVSDYLSATTDFALGSQRSDSTVLIRFAQAQLPKLAGWLVSAPVQAVGAVTSQTQACDGGGNLLISINDLNGNNKGDVGDVVSMTAMSCTFEGVTLNGKIIIVANSITGNPSFYPYAMSASMELVNLTAESSSIRTVGNGSLLLTLDNSGVNEGSLGLSASDFTLDSTYGAVRYRQELSSYASSVVIKTDSTGVSTSTSVSGTLTSSALESKSITIKTLAPFVRVNAEYPFTRPVSQTYPSSGQVLVTGASGSRARITATSDTTVLIELDADANGSYEKSTSKLWGEML